MAFSHNTVVVVAAKTASSRYSMVTFRSGEAGVVRVINVDSVAVMVSNPHPVYKHTVHCA